MYDNPRNGTDRSNFAAMRNATGPQAIRPPYNPFEPVKPRDDGGMVTGNGGAIVTDPVKATPTPRDRAFAAMRRAARANQPVYGGAARNPVPAGGAIVPGPFGGGAGAQVPEFGDATRLPYPVPGYGGGGGM